MMADIADALEKAEAERDRLVDDLSETERGNVVLGKRAEQAEAERDAMRAVMAENEGLHQAELAERNAHWSKRCDAMRDVVSDAISDLREHVEDGCAGPRGNARSYACRECALSERLARALDATPTEVK